MNRMIKLRSILAIALLLNLGAPDVYGMELEVSVDDLSIANKEDVSAKIGELSKRINGLKGYIDSIDLNNKISSTTINPLKGLLQEIKEIANEDIVKGSPEITPILESLFCKKSDWLSVIHVARSTSRFNIRFYQKKAVNNEFLSILGKEAVDKTLNENILLNENNFEKISKLYRMLEAIPNPIYFGKISFDMSNNFEKNFKNKIKNIIELVDANSDYLRNYNKAYDQDYYNKFENIEIILYRLAYMANKSNPEIDQCWDKLLHKRTQWLEKLFVIESQYLKKVRYYHKKVYDSDLSEENKVLALNFINKHKQGYAACFKVGRIIMKCGDRYNL